MLAARARSVPDIAFASSESSSALNTSLSPSFSIFTASLRRLSAGQRDTSRCATWRLGDDAEHFAAEAGGARLAIGHHPFGGGDDGDAEPIHDARELVAPFVDAQTRSGHALDFLDHRLAGIVLEADLELRFPFVLADGESVDIPLVLEHLGDGDLELG